MNSFFEANNYVFHVTSFQYRSRGLQSEEKWRKVKKSDYKTKISIHMPSEMPGTHTDGTWKEIVFL